jgi:phospholipase C
MNPAGMGYDWAVCPSFAECLDTAQAANLVPGSQFATDAASGNLPSFALLTPGDDTVSEHNGFSMAKGDNWIGQQIQAIENGPDWDSTAIFVTWDDCGCFYDQAPPGTNPDGTPQGPRVPLLIVSPYAKPGFTDTTPTTFAGILAYTEQTFGLAPLGANDAAAYGFANAFDYTQVPLKPVGMVSRPVPKGERIGWGQAREDS